MDDEVITWNLKGPKRMKKRRELNALIKNNYKYKSVPQKNLPNSSSIDMCHMSNGNGMSRLLKNENGTSSENEDFYFSANKSVLKEKKRNYYCKIFKIQKLINQKSNLQLKEQN